MNESSILKRVKRFNAFKFKDGQLYLWNIPGTLTPLSMTSYFWWLLEEKFGQKEAMLFLYELGKIQGKHASNIIIEKYGFQKNNISEKKKVLDLILFQSEVVGHGKFKWIYSNFKKEIFILKGKSSMAENYKDLFGIQNQPIDHFLRGEGTAIFEQVLNKKMFCIEKECIANGKGNCIFVIKPFNSWNKKDPLFISQFLNKRTEIKKLELVRKPSSLMW